MRALLCVGVAYLLVAILDPEVARWIVPGATEQLHTLAGAIAATMARACSGRSARIFVIWAFRAGGVPNYVMPIVFGLRAAS